VKWLGTLVEALGNVGTTILRWVSRESRKPKVKKPMGGDKELQDDVANSIEDQIEGGRDDEPKKDDAGGV
jgi:hypothetical protein